MQFDRMKHWDEVYSSRPSNKLGWYQETPEISLSLIDSLDLEGYEGIIDVGGGDSLLLKFLLKRGFDDLTLLDVSAHAIERSRLGLGLQAEKVNWINSDIVDFKPNRSYDLWHDRACFHFLISDNEISAYAGLAREGVRPGGHLILGGFAGNGPEKCSGLPVHRYSGEEMQALFQGFEMLEDRHLAHQTPSGFEQNYIFCLFKRKH